MTRIEENAFRDCSSLTSITLTEGLKSIGYCAFRGCVSLTSIKIPNSVAEFECFLGYSSTFEGCSNLTSVTLPNGITGVGKDEETFEGCSKDLKINGVSYFGTGGQQVRKVTPIVPKPVFDLNSR